MLLIRVLLFAGFASSLPAAFLDPVPSLPVAESSRQIVRRTQAGQPFTVAGEEGALFGRQNGKFEAWLWPVKLLSNFSIRAELFDYPVPIDVNALSAEIRVTPAETIITYSHAAFTIRQRMFVSRGRHDSPVPPLQLFSRSIRSGHSTSPFPLRPRCSGCGLLRIMAVPVANGFLAVIRASMCCIQTIQTSRQLWPCRERSPEPWFPTRSIRRLILSN